jgi:hypothetical protein
LGFLAEGAYFGKCALEYLGSLVIEEELSKGGIMAAFEIP